MKIVKQLNQCVKKILYYDYERVWKDFFDAKVLECLKSSDQKAVYTGIILFHQLSKTYQYEHVERKKIYNAQFTKLNENFLAILSQCSDPNDETQAIFIKKIFKIYSKNFITIDLSKTIGNVSFLERWTEYIIFIIQFPVNITLPKERQDIFWKLKKVSYDLIESIYKKHCSTNPLKMKKDYEKYLYQTFSLKFFNTIKTIYINTTESLNYINDYCLCIIYKLFTAMINYNHFIDEVFQIFTGEYRLKIVNDTVLSKKDIDIWINEPKEHINNFLNIEMNYCTIRYTTFHLIFTMMNYSSNKKNEGQVNPMLPLLYEFFIKLLQSNQLEANKEIEAIKANTDITNEGIAIILQKNPDQIKHNLLKESILYLLSSVHSILGKKMPGCIDKIIEVFVLPELDSPIGLLRESGCNFIECFKEHMIQNNQLKIIITKKLCGILEKEKILSIRVMSALALPNMLKYACIQNLLKGNIKILLIIYLKLMNEIDVSEIIECLQDIFKYFKLEVREYIPNLCDCLIKNFIKIANKQQSDEDDEDDINDTYDSLTISNQIIETITDIIRIYSIDNEIYAKIEIYVNIILVYCLKNDTDRNFENGLDIIMEILEKTRILPKTLWAYYNTMIDSVVGTEKERQEYALEKPDSIYEGDQWDTTNQISKNICYFVIKDSDTFLTGLDQEKKSYLSHTFFYIKTVLDLSLKQKNLFKIKGAFEILRVLLESCREKINEIFNAILEFIIKHLQASQNPRYKIFIGDLFSSCFLYNPVLTLKYLEANNALEGSINYWLMSITKTEVRREIKHNIMGLCALISIYPMINNQFLLDLLKTLLDDVLILVEKGINCKKREDNDKELELDTQKILESIEHDIYDNETDPNKKVDNLLNMDLNDDESLEVDECNNDDIDDDDWFSDKEILTEVDKQSAIIFLKDMLTMMSSQHPTFFEHIQQLIGNDKMVILQNVIIEEEKYIQTISKRVEKQ